MSCARQAAATIDPISKKEALFGILVHQATGNVVSHGSANTGNLQTVGKAVVYKYIARQRKYLRLIL
jgi:hypothetical protein